ncbi:MAG TPA: fatty-acid--CoA ligase, partial [Mycobacterium sp.]
NIGRGYWAMPDQTRAIFGAKLKSRRKKGSHADGASVESSWLRTGDLGVYLDGQLYVTGRIADVVTIEGRNHYPQDIEATAADASPLVRRGYATAFSVPDGDGGQLLVIVAERAPGTGRVDPQPAIEAIRQAVSHLHLLSVSDVLLLPAGAIPRTTSGKLARRACRAQYLDGTLGVR